MEYPKANNTVDNVVIAQEEEGTFVLLIKRANDPYKGKWALPGGFINEGEDPSEAAKRELKEETGLALSSEPLAAGSFLTDDPRGWTISATYAYFIQGRIDVKGADDAEDAQWFDINSLPELAFGHGRVINKIVNG